MVPDPVRDWPDRAGTADRRRLLNALDAAAGPTGFESAIQAAEALIRQDGTPDPAALGMLARRIVHGAEPEATGVDLGVYDNVGVHGRGTGMSGVAIQDIVEAGRAASLTGTVLQE